MGIGAVIATRARVGSGDEHEICGVTDMLADSAKGDSVIF